MKSPIFKIGGFYTCEQMRVHEPLLKLLKNAIYQGTVTSVYFDTTTGGFWLKGPFGPHNSIGYLNLGIRPNNHIPPSTLAETLSYGDDLTEMPIDKIITAFNYDPNFYKTQTLASPLPMSTRGGLTNFILLRIPLRLLVAVLILIVVFLLWKWGPFALIFAVPIAMVYFFYLRK